MFIWLRVASLWATLGKERPWPWPQHVYSLPTVAFAVFSLLPSLAAMASSLDVKSKFHAWALSSATKLGLHGGSWRGLSGQGLLGCALLPLFPQPAILFLFLLRPTYDSGPTLSLFPLVGLPWPLPPPPELRGSLPTAHRSQSIQPRTPVYVSVYMSFSSLPLTVMRFLSSPALKECT